MVSWRIRELGRTIGIGDIVRKKCQQLKSQDGEEERGEEASNQSTDQHNAVEFVTKENIGSYSIEDVAMPLPGWDIQLPQNQCKCVFLASCHLALPLLLSCDWFILKVERSTSDCYVKKASHWNS